MDTFSFTVTKTDTTSDARLGVIHTPHGDIETPAFIPVGTQASVKSLTPSELLSVGTQMFFVNTYHMAMRPGIDVVDRLGGLHSFMNWQHPLITDSGGFQVFSLARRSDFQPSITDQSSTHPARTTDQKETEKQPELVKISEDGVRFRSHWDGSYHDFTPEVSMEYQWKLGSDIHIAFDDCTPYPISESDAEASMERTHRWAIRSSQAHQELAKEYQALGRPYQALYGSVQGSVYQGLRERSADVIAGLDTDGIAIGGVSVGESKEEMYQVLSWVMPRLPRHKPKHLLGVGEFDDIFAAVKSGVDTFDCVQATRLARVGYLYTSDPEHPKHQIDIAKQRFAEDTQPIDTLCECFTCKNFTRAYLHHLFKVRELLAYRLATIHNLQVIHSLVFAIRQSIQSGTLLELEKQWLIG